MRYTIPDYYFKFKCTADQCEDTCCAGWQIGIDEASEQRYRKEKGLFRRTLRKNINFHDSVFRQQPDGSCAFLREDGLCEMVLQMGEEALCRTCHYYPRHIEEFENEREITLSVSCPEVAKILMSRREPVHFLHKEDEKEETYPDYDPIFFDQLQEAREVMIQILQNRSLPASVRAVLILGLAHDMQLRFDGGSFFTCQQLYSRYQSRKAASYASEWLKSKENKARQTAYQEGHPHTTHQEGYLRHPEKDSAVAIFSYLYNLEHLRADWETVLRETESLLFKEVSENDRDSYRRISKEFGAYIMTEYPDWEIQKEQLLVYFISTYFCGAVYDGHIYSKVRMAVLCVWYIEELLKARWLRNEKFLDTEEVCEIVYRFSREIEHSDQNLEAAEKIPIPFP